MGEQIRVFRGRVGLLETYQAEEAA